MVEQCLRVGLGCAAQWLKSNKKKSLLDGMEKNGNSTVLR
jgi:hypothetical protein